jgi:sortase B
MIGKGGRRRVWLVFSVLCLCAAAALAVAVLVLSGSARSVVPSPNVYLLPWQEQPVEVKPGVAVDVKTDVASQVERFDVVDWHYWQAVNPDIIGWVSVPGTHINYAVVQAPEFDPTYYLDHDIHRNWNPYGCPYVDADCSGTEGLHTVIFGHNMGFDRSMFSDFSRYSDEAFVWAHPEVLFQTPDEQVVLVVSSVCVISGTEQSKRIDFADRDELALWYKGRFASADLNISNDREAPCLVSFVTCSYRRSSDERTIIYTQPER